MLTKLSKWLMTKNTGWLTLLAIMLFMLFLIFVLPNQPSIAQQYAGVAVSPDTSFFYSAEDIYQMASIYGADGRSAYIKARLTFDVVWPLVYLAFLTSVITWFLQRKELFFMPIWLSLIPLLGCIFDYLENLGAVLVFAVFPAKIDFIAGLTGVFTMLKWITISLGFTIVLLLFLLFIYQAIVKKAKGKSN